MATSETVAQQLARLQAEIEDLRSRQQPVEATTKDLSLVSLVPKWAGTLSSEPLSEFIEAVETAADVGRWSNEDKVRIATLKLTDAAKAFYNTTPELQGKKVTWEAFKKSLRDRFRDVRTEQFHYAQLRAARQHRDEEISAFADRLRGLAQKLIPETSDPGMKKAHQDQAEKALLDTFARGLLGTPGQQVQYAVPASMGEAIKIAIAVQQADADRKQTFYLQESSDRPRERGRFRNKGSASQGSSGNAPKNGGRGSSGERPKKKNTCYNCGGEGHWAKVCPTPKKQRNQPQKRRGEEAKEGAKPKQEERRDAAGAANRPAGNWKEMAA
jgi:hypothetical protein